MTRPNLSMAASPERKKASHRQLILPALTRGPLAETEPQQQQQLPPTQLIDGLKLYLGRWEDSQNESLLQELNVKYVLNCTPDTDTPPRVGRLKGFLRLPLEDSQKQRLDPYMKTAFAFIDKALKNGENAILIHCKAGISRGPSMVLAYTIWRYGWSLDEGLEKLRARRPGACPNLNFLGQLYAMSTTN